MLQGILLAICYCWDQELLMWGVWSFLPPPNFPMCQNPEKKHHELATLWNDQVQDLPPQKNGRVQNLPPLNSPQLGTLPFFGGWQVLNLVISEGGQFRTLVFFWILAHREIWGWQAGSNTLYYHEARNSANTPTDMKETEQLMSNKKQ